MGWEFPRNKNQFPSHPIPIPMGIPIPMTSLGHPPPHKVRYALRQCVSAPLAVIPWKYSYYISASLCRSLGPNSYTLDGGANFWLSTRPATSTKGSLSSLLSVSASVWQEAGQASAEMSWAPKSRAPALLYLHLHIAHSSYVLCLCPSHSCDSISPKHLN